MQQVSVSDLMRLCPTAVIGEKALAREAAELLVVHNLCALIVQDAEGRVVGMLPESTVIRHLMQTTHRDEVVSHLMSRHVESVRADADLTSVLHLFRSSCHSVVPVVDTSGGSVGLLHRNDVVRYLLSDSYSRTDSRSTPADPSEQRKPHFIQHPGVPPEKPKLPGQSSE